MLKYDLNLISKIKISGMDMTRRYSILITGVFLLLTVFYSAVASLPYQDDGLGVFLDSLDDDSYIDSAKSHGYKVSDGYLSIDFGEISHYYDCNNLSNEIKVSYRKNIQPFFILYAFAGPDIPLEVNFSNLSKLKSIDNTYFEVESDFPSIFVPLQHYRLKIDQDPQNISLLVFHWAGLSNGGNIRVFAWDYLARNGEGMWRYRGEIYGNTDSIVIGESDSSNFISKGKYIDIVLVPWPSAENVTYLWTDYISLEVREISRKNATVITKPIEPAKLWRWEYIELEKDVEEDSSIKVQILDEDGVPISDDVLDGNSKGFEDEIVPLCYLTGERKIRIKFLLETNNFEHNPKLLQYKVLWQINSGKWIDDLSTDHRIEKRSGSVILSKSIYLPRGYWWKEFQAKVDLSGGGRVTFSIIDERGETLIGNITGKTLTKYYISNICTRSIKLKAEIEKNGSFTPKIEEWCILFSRESEKPLTDYPTIIYINREDMGRGSIDIEISAKDDFPGLYRRSAKYRLEYIDNLTRFPYYSGWVSIDIDIQNCSKDWISIPVKDVPIFYEDSLKDLLGLNRRLNLTLHKIQFRVEDMAGNIADSDWIRVEIDTNPPDSWITTSVDQLGFKHSYGYIEISADAVDDISNVKSVTLYYMVSDDNISYSSPIEYSTLQQQPWVWTFFPYESGYYKFFTVAEDNAGNVEDFKDGELTLLIDISDPEKPDFEDEVYWLNSPQIDFVTFRDDLRIYSIEYRVSGEEYFEWKEISKDINSKTYSEEWRIDTWDWEQMENGKVYTIFFRIKDLVGNEYVTPNEGEALKIGKDIIPPYPSIEPVKLWQSKLPIEISTYVSNQQGSDISKVILMYRYSTDNKTWSDWKVYNETVFSGWHTWLFAPEEGDGYYEIKLRAYDFAGNFDESEIISFGLTVLPEKEMISLMTVFVVFLIVSALIARKWD